MNVCGATPALRTNAVASPMASIAEPIMKLPQILTRLASRGLSETGNVS
jgi:hypothetical protein